MRTLVFAALAATCLSGCYTVKFGNAETAGDRAGPSHHGWTHSLFWGMLPLGRVNIDQCGDAGIKRMKSQVGGLGLIAYALTGGIWTPMHVKITCARADKDASLPSPQVRPLDEGHETAIVWADRQER